jgi:hypothetical protein
MSLELYKPSSGGFTRPGDYRDALQKIADGDNDPRQTARAALDKWDDYKEPGQ